MADTFNLTGSLNSQTYVAGATMTLTVTGTVSGTSTAQDTLSLVITASDGATTTLSVGPVTVTSPTSPTWKITSVADTQGRTWTISAAGNTATATA